MNNLMEMDERHCQWCWVRPADGYVDSMVRELHNDKQPNLYCQKCWDNTPMITLRQRHEIRPLRLTKFRWKAGS